jgi:hypothetical protein
MKRKRRVKFISVKASSPQIRRIRVSNMDRWVLLIWGGEWFTKKVQRTVTKYEKIQIQRIQTKNKAVFIPDKAHKQNLSPYQHKVCAPIWNISHILSSLFHCSLHRKDQYRTNKQRLVAHLLQSNGQRKEQLGQCPNLMECQTELDPDKPFSSVFFKDQEGHSTQADWFWI